MIAYLVTNSINGKHYIGVTVQPLRKRWIQHLSHARVGKTTPLHCALRKYGFDAFTVEHIATALDFPALCALERALIAQFDSRRLGYNATPGGVVTSKEAAQKGARSFTGKPRSDSVKQRLSELARGRRHTAESRAKMSATRKGKRFGPRPASVDAWQKRRKHLAGASPSKRHLWQAHIWHDGRSQYLGTFRSERAAHEAWRVARGAKKCGES